MISLPARSGMPEDFGIRIISAQKDKLVGEIDVDHRHLNKGGIVHADALLAGKLAAMMTQTQLVLAREPAAAPG
jgi:acyl-coenzyme A thioesterase PaaI-like protein